MNATQLNRARALARMTLEELKSSHASIEDLINALEYAQGKCPKSKIDALADFLRQRERLKWMI